MGTVPGYGLYFLGYETSKHHINKWMKRTEENTNPFTYFVSGVVADVFGCTIWTPMDVIQQKLRMETRTFRREVKSGTQGVPRELSAWNSFNTIIKGLQLTYFNQI